MNALVIGSHGFIGGYVCQRLIRAGWEVVGVDSINMYKPQYYELFLRHFEVRQKTQLSALSTFYRVDGAHRAEMARIVRKHRPTVVINLAGIAAADVCVKNTEE